MMSRQYLCLPFLAELGKSLYCLFLPSFPIMRFIDLVIEINKPLSPLWANLSLNHEFLCQEGLRIGGQSIRFLNVNLLCPGLGNIPKTPGGNNIDYLFCLIFMAYF